MKQKVDKKKIKINLSRVKITFHSAYLLYIESHMRTLYSFPLKILNVLFNSIINSNNIILLCKYIFLSFIHKKKNCCHTMLLGDLSSN